MTFSHLELSHLEKTTGGLAPEWTALQDRRNLVPSIKRLESGEDYGQGEEDGISVIIDEDVGDGDGERLDELGEGMYLKSGDPVAVREAVELERGER